MYFIMICTDIFWNLIILEIKTPAFVKIHVCVCNLLEVLPLSLTLLT